MKTSSEKRKENWLLPDLSFKIGLRLAKRIFKQKRNEIRQNLGTSGRNKKQYKSKKLPQLT